jgi:D-arabinose 1-dehydrogenase-like Zn-dependent alcohol dehydrogenase
MPYPCIIPHSDGAGTVDAVGEGVSQEWIGRRVWCYGAQTYRPFGTAAAYTVVPLQQAVPLPATVPVEQGACLGIPGITAHRAVHVDVPTEAKIEATRAINQALAAGWQVLDIAERFSLDDIAQAYEFVEHPTKSGRVIVTI